MKKLSLLLLLIVLYLAARPQSNIPAPDNKAKRFFFSMNYSYLDSDLKLLSMTKHSVWDGRDYGITELEQDQIDTLNSFISYNEKLHDLNLAAGMVLLKNPGSPWNIDCQLVLGLVKRANSIVNTAANTTEQEINSENFSPTYGIGLNFSYLLNEKWKLKLYTQTLYASGTTDEIQDNIFPEVPTMDESRESQFKESYSRIDLFAAFNINNFCVSAGPGFYFLYNTHKYKIVRTNPEDGKIYEDTIETSLKNKNFINGNINLGWKFSNHFLINAGAGISNDITVTAGLVYFL
jgi:hypothetical protein